MAFFIISILLYKIAQLYEESVLKLSLGEDVNAAFFPDSNLSKEYLLDELLQVPSLPEPMETEMLSNLPPQPKSEPEAMQVSEASHLDSELSIEGF